MEKVDDFLKIFCFHLSKGKNKKRKTAFCFWESVLRKRSLRMTAKAVKGATYRLLN